MDKQPDEAAPPGDAARDSATGTARPCRGNLRNDWLETKLKGLYDDVANEPLPDALRQLIEKLDG
ncbi:hypothetical protein STAQ_35890 [Allostella sp. ATCC 35155]|nr:hypothetical protein STAQ_35890 [Stella sp. ATCC 35155]